MVQHLKRAWIYREMQREGHSVCIEMPPRDTELTIGELAF